MHISVDSRVFLKTALKLLFWLPIYLFVSVPEMVLCRVDRKYINSALSFAATKQIYLLTKGWSEFVERSIFGTRRWRDCQSFTLGELEPSLRSEVKSSLYLHGCERLPYLVDVQDFLHDLRRCPFNSRLTGASLLLSEMYNKPEGILGRWDINQSLLFSLPSLSRILLNENILSTIRSVCGVEAVITSCLVWASFPTQTLRDAIKSAQVCHIDYDYLDDVKIFLNLSSTDLCSGPLEYFQQSHFTASKPIWSLSPICSSLLESYYPDMKPQHFIGPVGSVFISDNRGYHRDRPPEDGCWKLALQINISRSQYGSESHYSSSRPQLSPSWPSYTHCRRALTKHPTLFSLLFSPCSVGLGT